MTADLITRAEKFDPQRTGYANASLLVHDLVEALKSAQDSRDSSAYVEVLRDVKSRCSDIRYSGDEYSEGYNAGLYYVEQAFNAYDLEGI